MIFKYDDFRNYLSEIKKHGKTELFRNWNGEKCFLLRHDVDFSIYLAHKLAVIENQMDVISTFFILTSCQTYNPLSVENRKLLREIVEMGHEVGLHFDPTLYHDDLDRNLNKEAEILSFASGVEVKSVSLHNPSVHGQYPLFNRYVNAYDPKFFSDKNYISDSRFMFKGKNPYTFLKGVENSMIQILLHPMHYSETGGGYDQIFFDSHIRAIQDIHDAFKVNSTYNEQVGADIMKIFKERL